MDPGQDIGVRLAGGDDDALEECYALYGASVLAYLRRLVGRDEAEDVLQRTFLDVWRHADRYDPAQSFSGWLFTIAHRRAVDHLRGRRPTVIPVEVLREVMGDDGRETAERFAWAADVRAALTQLPQEQRETIGWPTSANGPSARSPTSSPCRSARSIRGWPAGRGRSAPCCAPAR